MLRTALHWDRWISITTSVLCVLLWYHIFVEETESLTIVLARIKVHLWLYLEHKIALVSTEEPRFEIVFLSIKI